jgi:hypothetical protein
MILALTPLMLGSCAKLGDLRTDITRVRSDLHTNTEALLQLSARVDALERRQAATDSTAQQTRQELSQAIEVRLKKALMTKNRRTTHASGKRQSKGAERPEKQARQQPSETPSPSFQGEHAPQRGKHLSLGMTQEEVHRTLGAPLWIDDAGSYIFWQYAQMSNQKYVVFDKVTGQVSGWLGM